jgi:hypothetical protein
MHKCAADRLATVAAVVVSTPQAAQQDFARQDRLAAFARQAPLDFVQAVLADSAPVVSDPTLLELDQVAFAPLALAPVLSPEADSLRAGDLLRAEHLPLARQASLDSEAGTFLSARDSVALVLGVLGFLIDALAASLLFSLAVASF